MALLGAGLVGCATRTAAVAAPAANDVISTTAVAPTTTVIPTPPTTGPPAPPVAGPPVPTTVIPTPTSVPPEPTTTVAPEPTTTVPPLPGNAAGYIHATYDAWAAGDRAAAARVAEPSAVEALFARTWSDADGWAFLRCEGAAGSVFCVWQGPGEQLWIKARNTAGGVPVNTVEFRVSP